MTTEQETANPDLPQLATTAEIATTSTSVGDGENVTWSDLMEPSASTRSETPARLPSYK